MAVPARTKNGKPARLADGVSFYDLLERGARSPVRRRRATATSRTLGEDAIATEPSRPPASDEPLLPPIDIASWDRAPGAPPETPTIPTPSPGPANATNGAPAQQTSARSPRVIEAGTFHVPAGYLPPDDQIQEDLEDIANPARKKPRGAGALMQDFLTRLDDSQGGASSVALSSPSVPDVEARLNPPDWRATPRMTTLDYAPEQVGTSRETIALDEVDIVAGLAEVVDDHKTTVVANGDRAYETSAPAYSRERSLTLGDSVGDGGVNAPADVIALKSRLKDLGFDWLQPDQDVDDDTIAAIKLFQSIVRGLHAVRGDGRVDVPGTTYSWLQASNAPHWRTMPAGSAAEGFDNAELRDTTDNHDFGTDWMATTIAGAGVDYRSAYIASHAGAALLTINDVSLPHGGDTPDHAGHETGLDCDIRLPLTNGTAPGGITYEHRDYDRDAMRAMLTAIAAQPLVSRILFNDPVLIREGLCKRTRGHDNHAHVEIKPPALNAAAAGASGQSYRGAGEPDPLGRWASNVSRSASLGDGSPFVALAVDQCFQRLEALRNSLGDPANASQINAGRIRSETGVVADANPYFGITREELEAVIRAGFNSHQAPEVLLALWAKEGSTRSVTVPVEVPQATSETNARALFRSTVYFEDMGADHFIRTTRPAGGGDNLFDRSDAAAPGHETHFAASVQELVNDGLLSEDVAAPANAELLVSRLANGHFAVQPTTKFYALSLLLMDAFFTKLSQRPFPQLTSIPPGLNYMQWNMGEASFRAFLESADRHRQEPQFLTGGVPITIEQWALHTAPRSNEYFQARTNAIKFVHYVDSYAPIFALSMNLITPGIEDLRLGFAHAAEDTPDAGAPPSDAAPPALPALTCGVASGVITDPFYRSAEEKQRLFNTRGGRDRHLGIDVSLNRAAGGGAEDVRRGLPVYATIRPTIDLADLNNVRADNSGVDQAGLGIAGSGQASLQNALVRTQPWAPQDDNAYGGVLGLACRYAYTRNDGSAGQFTLYLEYLHLITPAYLPKDGAGRVISAADWAATGKGLGFGPEMQNNTSLSAADLTGGAPLLVGYLGATQFPHVHIQAAFRDGSPSYVRTPRFDPTIMIA